MNNKIEKLSYEELIKALDCCAHTIENNMCGECPAAKYKAGTCDDMVKLQAAEMLKGFKVENENLKERAIPTSGFINLLNGAHVYTKTLEEYNEFRKSIKSSVINEFAERLCDGRVSNDPVVISVKAELKEVVGEQV